MPRVHSQASSGLGLKTVTGPASLTPLTRTTSLVKAAQRVLSTTRVTAGGAAPVVTQCCNTSTEIYKTAPDSDTTGRNQFWFSEGAPTKAVPAVSVLTPKTTPPVVASVTAQDDDPVTGAYSAARRAQVYSAAVSGTSDQWKRLASAAITAGRCAVCGIHKPDMEHVRACRAPITEARMAKAQASNKPRPASRDYRSGGGGGYAKQAGWGRRSHSPPKRKRSYSPKRRKRRSRSSSPSRGRERGRSRSRDRGRERPRHKSRSRERDRKRARSESPPPKRRSRSRSKDKESGGHKPRKPRDDNKSRERTDRRDKSDKDRRDQKGNSWRDER